MSKQEIEWRTEVRKLKDIKDHPENPRDFTEKGMSDLKESLENLGYIDLIAINADGTILGGHARKIKLLEMGKKQAEVRVPNRLLNEDEAKEAIIRLNKNTAGAWNMQKLDIHFEKKKLMQWGFEKADFNNFAQKVQKEVSETKGFFVLLQFETEKEQEKFFNEMTERNLKCKLLA